VHGAAWHAASLVRADGDRALVWLQIDRQLALDDEEELVLVVVLVPVEVALDDAQADHGVVDRDERLVEPRFVRRGLTWDVDQLEMAERVAVAQLDVPDARVEVRERSARLRLDHGGFDVVAGE